jgi:hypothetical protein
VQVADAPVDTTTAQQTIVSPLQRPVVVTLVHGTVLFARWPRVLRLLTSFAKMWPRAQAKPAWHMKGSQFSERLLASLGPHAHVASYCWSGGNSVWARIHAAGADGDFGKAAARNTLSLRQHVAQMAVDHDGAAQVLVAHSHGGNVCLYALRDESTARAVDGLVCLSTPFVHARERVDSGVLDDFLKVLLGLVYLVVFFGASQWVSSRVPEPWDSVIFVSSFTVAIMAGALWWVRRDARQRALRLWAESVAQPHVHRPPTMVLLSDGDEALLALKISEGLNVVSRGLWRVTFSLPSVVWQTIGRWGRWRAVVYGVLSLAALVFLLLNDVQSPFVDPEKTWSALQVLKFLAAAFMIPMALYIVLGLALSAPALVAMLLGYPLLVFSRWLAFGWGGSIGVEITAETCPLGDASITRLGPPADATGLRHAHSYHDERAPESIAEFIVQTIGGHRANTLRSSG